VLSYENPRGVGMHVLAERERVPDASGRARMIDLRTGRNQVRLEY
jgi:hypothetical protein